MVAFPISLAYHVIEKKATVDLTFTFVLFRKLIKQSYRYLRCLLRVMIEKTVPYISLQDFSGRVKGLKVDAVDTTGAGDAFVAGILLQLAGDLSLLQVWQFIFLIKYFVYYSLFFVIPPLLTEKTNYGTFNLTANLMAGIKR